MDLILMRHGKAELRSDAKPDFERELTSIGRKKISTTRLTGGLLMAYKAMVLA